MELNGKNRRRKKGVLPSPGEQRDAASDTEWKKDCFFVILLAKALDKESTGWQAFIRLLAWSWVLISGKKERNTSNCRV
jgi:hypothetical protein